MYLFIHHFTVQDLEGIEMNALVEGENGIANGRIVSKAEVLLRRARGRGRMTVPVGEDLQTVLTGILQCRKLILRGEGEVFRRVVDVLHPVVLGHHITVWTANTQQEPHDSFGASCRAWLINLSMISFGIFIA